MTLTIAAFAALLAWGTIVGLDLVSVLQGMLSRPLVAASVAGAIAGSLGNGLLAGMVLELYALDVLPIGASRYPDYSVAAVAGGVAAALAPTSLAAGIAGVIALPMAALGGWSLQQLRRKNANSVRRRLDRVAAGDERAIAELQHRGIARDGMRSLALALIGVGIAMLTPLFPWQRFPNADLLSLAMLAGGIAAALGGAVRSAGVGARRYFLVAGLATGSVVAWLR